MDRRLFLRGVLGIAGAAAVASALRPVESFAGMPSSPGILDELDQAEPENLEGAEVQQIWHRRWHRPHRRWHRRRRGWRWRTVCRRYWRNGRWRRRCFRRRVWAGW